MDAEKILDNLFAKWDNSEQDLAIDNHFPYILTKAVIFLSSGANNYQKHDFFNEPSKLDSSSVDRLKLGCKQIIEGKGLTAETAFSDLGISGLYQLMRMFHFKRTRKHTEYNYQGNSTILDQITFQHRVDNRIITLFNKIDKTKNGL